MKKIEFSIIHNGSDWVIENQYLTLSSRTIEGLDIKVRALLRDRGLVQKGETAKVLMAFDNTTIPQWIRQYAQHYFNRIILVEG